MKKIFLLSLIGLTIGVTACQEKKKDDGTKHIESLQQKDADYSVDNGLDALDKELKKDDSAKKDTTPKRA